MIIFALKAFLIGLWVMAGAAFIAPDQVIYADVFKIIGAVFVLFHHVEIFLFRKWHRCPKDYVNSFVFGMLHIKLLQHRIQTHNDQG
ncbi:MAG: hypothetical protein COB54_06935 [Alphaproteobacteria bacterium]|nr:MAG: hypothetical protein COB54_06935 [Alphaproteobacteria bacterium]